jgi:hypothetical protein
VKDAIFEAHTGDPAAWPYAKLAEKYKVRQQRIMAIVALKQARHASRTQRTLMHARTPRMRVLLLTCHCACVRVCVQIERDWAAKGRPLANDLARAAERACGATDVGTGERYVAALPTEPSFEVVHDDLPAERMPAAAAAADDAAESEKRERALVAEFTARLARATGAAGGGLWARSRVRDAPRRPAGGWGLLVKPLGLKGGAAPPAPSAPAPPSGAVYPSGAYVARPDGTRRALNDDERAMLQQQKIKPRRKLT